MPTYEHAVDVRATVEDVYYQWTQFEEFPKFMQGIEEVRQLTDETLYWHANIAGIDQEWHAAITEQIPHKRIAWTSTSGAEHGGVVTFHRLSDEETRITLQIDYNPDGFIENVGAALGVVEGRMSGDLQRFKHLIETLETPTGKWDGEIPAETQSV
jgi:uncharacterized membrane protein